VATKLLRKLPSWAENLVGLFKEKEGSLCKEKSGIFFLSIRGKVESSTVL
jgi:hypothetical protein